MNTNQTFIPVSIATGYEHETGNKTEQAKQQIELSSFYLQSLFNSINRAAASLNEQMQESDASLKAQETCDDLRNLSEIGYALSGSIFESLANIKTIETETVSNPPDDFDDGTLDNAETDTLALALSEILRSSNLPESVYNAVQTGLNDVYNDFDESTVNEFESSPEYIAFVLNGAKNTEAQ